MAIFSKFIHKLARAAQMLENPRLLRVRWRGGSGAASTAAELDQPWLREFRFATVLDIGANTGQFAIAARAIFPAARIVSFEPLADCCEKLKRVMHGDSNFAAFNVALAVWRLAGGPVTLPVPHIAWVGAPPPLPKSEFAALANGDAELQRGLEALHDLFVRARLLYDRL